MTDDTQRLDWLLAHRFLRVQGDEKHGWCVLDCRNGLTFVINHTSTAREAIDQAALKLEPK